ncbi:18933_t:CDS:1, partial [Gigaspora margarita]
RTPKESSKNNETKPTKSNVTKSIKCNKHRQNSKDDNEIGAMKLSKCLIHISKLQQQYIQISQNKKISIHNTKETDDNTRTDKVIQANF